jgi:hypothetical protein
MTKYKDLPEKVGPLLDVTNFDLGEHTKSKFGVLSRVGVNDPGWNVNKGLAAITAVGDDGYLHTLLTPATKANVEALSNSDLRRDETIGVPFSCGQLPASRDHAGDIQRFWQTAGSALAAENRQPAVSRGLGM